MFQLRDNVGSFRGKIQETVDLTSKQLFPMILVIIVGYWKLESY